MNNIQWFRAMNNAGWHRRTKTTLDDDDKITIVVFWQNENVVKADGTPITIDDDTARAHQYAGTTPPPF